VSKLHTLLLEALADGEWHTLAQLARKCQYGEPTIRTGLWELHRQGWPIHQAIGRLEGYDPTYRNSKWERVYSLRVNRSITKRLEETLNA
jgi:DNA-binding IclR family transcriptional regulator